MQPLSPKKRSGLPDSAFYPVVLISLVAWGVMVSCHASWQMARESASQGLRTSETEAEQRLYQWTSIVWLGSILALCIVHRQAARRRRQAEEELSRRAQVFRNSYDAILVTDMDYRVLDWNPSAERVFGYSKREVLGERPFVLVSLAVARQFAELVRRSIIRRTPVSAEIPFYRKNGTEGLCEAVVAAMEDESGCPIALIMVARDITERRRAEQSLQEALQKAQELEAIINRSPAVALLWRLGEGWPVEFVSENVDQFGYTADELQSGRVTWASLVHAADLPRLEAGRAALTQEGETLAEYRLVTKSGALRWVADRTIARCTASGEISHYQGVVVDITERRLAEEALRREKNFAEMLIEGAPAIVLVLDTEGKILRCNPYMESITGYRVVDVLGVDAVANYLPSEVRQRTRERLRLLLTGAEHLAQDIPIIAHDGTLREIEWSSRALRDAENQVAYILAIGRDTTELKQAQQRALQAERLAAIGQMVTGLAHESGNALQRSQSCLEMLALEVQDRPAAMDLVNRIQLAQDHLHQLYEEVRQYAAPIVLRQETAYAAELVQQAWNDLEPMWTGRTVQFQLANGHGGPCQVDRYALERVFRNILENSLAACHDPVTIDVACQETQLDGRPAVQVRLHDNGPGLNLEQRNNIFEPFYTTKTQGTGLGMAISKRIVEAHGGQIAVGDSLAPGAEIVVLLPRG